MHVMYWTFNYSLDEPIKYEEITKEYCRILWQSLWKHYKIHCYDWLNSCWVSYQTNKLTDKHCKSSFSWSLTAGLSHLIVLHVTKILIQIILCSIYWYESSKEKMLRWKFCFGDSTFPQSTTEKFRCQVRNMECVASDNLIFETWFLGIQYRT